ncbi:MAG: ATP-dependent metallopeptidase FtsH/Yme1/Tma family protein [Sulfurimonas sp.]|nr:ATP-dependent metallopeptidase FtsH/Yme1/Tma family protein [Sulfurimonas sp.]MDD3060616.1 ATP-dependent metallopeptidase FtsH/Yme1/Tma family protein [Sulfurimonas sp.]MDD5203499.1 ATP-dependent metallopeptidase FtsH/Yme1/Tma family protein [Sulfurimonas sp.]
MLNSKTNRIILLVSAFFVIALILFAIFRDNASAITLRDAQKILENKSVQKVVVTKEYVYLKTQDNFYKIASNQVTPKMFIDYKVEVGSESNFLLYILYVVLILGLGSLVVKWFEKRGFTTFGTNAGTATSSLNTEPSGPIEAIKSDVTFSDIGGIADVKMELEEIIDFMRNPKRYKSFGARMPRGVLLVGPPGVGKTMIAKAVAYECGVPFYYQSGASFVQIYVGMGAKRVHELFAAAKKNAPAIIFIDEIDAVGKKRDGQRNDEREATLNQLLTEMDGFEGSSGVIVLAATNKIEVLDSALLRAGRFDRRVFVELPTKSERQAILAKYLEKVPHELEVKTLANMTVGFNGASLAALVNEAALLSLRQKDFKVTLEHFHQVKDKVMFGKKKLSILSDEQKKYRITYQAAKAVCATVFDLAFEKLMLSNEKLTPTTNEPLIKHELEYRIKMLLSGIAACSIKYDEHASSAKDDLDEAKELTKKMLEEYGMGSSLIQNKQEEDLYLQRLYSETKELLESMIIVVNLVEKVLYERESITKDEVKKFLDEVL